ncbi:endonuclease VII domain-containing protein [Kitasatospora sp. NPDC048365]|uniref:endonuclease VII domain-containing protein n=1 Tax=Kitasatospora sp. NPDC048365 TaxID=3364050 RepID=UPI00371B61B8
MENFIPAKAPSICSNCGKEYRPLRNKLCQPCYRREARYGTPEYKEKAPTVLTVEWVESQCRWEGDCLVWEGTTSKEGNPQTSDRELWESQGINRQILLHRWLFEQDYGVTLRKGQHVKRSCGKNLCLASDHLSAKPPFADPNDEPAQTGQVGPAPRPDAEENCANGHLWTEETLHIDPKGRWSCRRCNAESKMRAKGIDPATTEWQRRKPREEVLECSNGHVYGETGFYFNGETRVCKPCFALKERKRWLRVLYGLTIEDFERMLAEQSLKCAICAVEFDPEEHDRKPVVDHNHKTGAVRELLCHKCNLALGHFEDDVTRLRSAIDYLIKHSAPS